jgi:predicted ferric reductase
MTIGDVVVVDQIWWYTSRAAGIVAWVLLSSSVIAGMSISTRDSRRLPTGWPIDLHRFLSALSLVFLGVHMAALVPDNFVEFGWVELLVPFASTWRPWAVALGVVAFWLVVAVELTSLIRRRLPTRLWRAVHLLSFLVWLSSTIHLFLAGTDVGSFAFRVIQVCVIAAVSSLFVRRVAVARRRRTRSAASAPLPVEEAVDVDEVYAGKR